MFFVHIYIALSSLYVPVWLLGNIHIWVAILFPCVNDFYACV